MNDKQINRYFKLAKNAMEFSDYPKIHIGAIMVYKNKIISVGYNTMKSNPMQREYNIYRGGEDNRDYDVEKQNNSIHAEMMCLLSTRHLDIEWNKVSIFVYREYKDGSKAIARPCKACTKALIDRGIKNIYYTINNGYSYERRE